MTSVLRREIYQRVRDAFEQKGIHFTRPQVVVAGGSVGGSMESILAEQAAAAGLAQSSPA